MSRKEIKARFPVARIKKIMQADEDIGKVAQATPLVVAKALELFMVALINESCSQARSRNSKRVTPAHLKQAVLTTERFDFLADTVARLPDSPVAANHSNGDDMGDQRPRQRKSRTIKAKQQQQQPHHQSEQQSQIEHDAIADEKDQQQYVATMPSISTVME